MEKIIYMASTLNMMKPGDVNILAVHGELKELSNGYQYMVVTIPEPENKEKK